MKKSSKTWLVLDVHYLAHRAFHTTPKGSSSGVIYGVLRAVLDIKEQFGTDRVVFCFEHPNLYRKNICPTYKLKRHKREMTPEEREAYKGLILQISELQLRWLPKIGFKNIYSFNGMESDDIMAKIAEVSTDPVVIVTADADLYQCLGPGVSIFAPTKDRILTETWFRNKYGISPKQWALVKAIAGCSSDEVPGIKGVGEITAVKFIRGELPEKSKAYQAIMSEEGKAIVRANRPIIELPFEGCPEPILTEDHIDRSEWKEVCRLLGMPHLAGRSPTVTVKKYGRQRNKSNG
jgi:5'-3' exonuclease